MAASVFLCLLSASTLQDWTTMSTTGAPAGYTNASAVWTGTEMIVWGGLNSSGNFVNTGARYNPVTDTWTPVSTTGAPGGRLWHTAVWTGTRMVIWGGTGNFTLNDGGLYDPVTDTWSPLSTTGAPLGKVSHCCVWTGTEMIIWGGSDSSGASSATGGRYNPATDTWSTITTVNAPSARAYATGIWSGTEMIVWAGNDNGSSTAGSLSSGGRYNPITDSWTPMTLSGAPAPRYEHVAVWTGTLMMVWGGLSPIGTNKVDLTNTGGLYNPASDQWTSTTLTAAPNPASDSGIVWTGEEVITWGGSSLQLGGGRYNPARDEWTPVIPGGAPNNQFEFAVAWSGSEMLVWGGNTAPAGGRYRPPPLTAVKANGSCLGTVSLAAPGRPVLFATAFGSVLILILLRRRTTA